MRLLIKKEQRTKLPDRTKDIIIERGWSFLVKDTTRDVHLKEGVIKKEELSKPSGSAIVSSKGKSFIILDPSFSDRFERLRKAPQTIPVKDLAWIAGMTGLNKSSVVVELGGGSGAASCYFASLVKKVWCYELLEAHASVIRENLLFFGLKNVTVTVQDILKEPPKKKGDFVMIDIPTPWETVPFLAKLINTGGYVANYSPPIVSTQKFVNALAKDDRFQIIGTVELVERPWKVEGEAVRPATTKIGHSGFITVARKLHD